MKANFLLNDPTIPESSVYIALTGYGQRIKIGTGVTVKVSEWDSTTQMWVSSHNSASIANLKLNQWKSALLSLMAEAELNHWTLQMIKDKLLAQMGKESRGVSKAALLPYYATWASTDTTRRKAFRTLLYAYNLIKTYTHSDMQLTFDHITYDWCENYIEWMAKRGLNDNTRGTQIKHLKAVMNEAFEKGLHHNEAFRKFRKESSEVDNVALSPDEVRALEELDLVGTKSMARDLFLIGCYTALRYSDYCRLSVFDGEDGFIKMTQQKTKGRVVIPCSPKLRKILLRWNGSPKLSQQKLNGHIKQICKEAGITQRINIYKGGKMQIVEKWELVTSHTARRTAATNMYRAGIPAISIMKITGHSTEANFLKYIKLSKEENAMLLSSNAFFQ